MEAFEVILCEQRGLGAVCAAHREASIIFDSKLSTPPKQMRCDDSNALVAAVRSSANFLSLSSVGRDALRIPMLCATPLKHSSLDARHSDRALSLAVRVLPCSSRLSANIL